MITNFVFVYLDDILVFSLSVKEHQGHVRQVLQKLLEHKLYVKGEKCECHVSTVSFLGSVVSQGQISMEKSKTEVVEKWPASKSHKDLQRFFGIRKLLPPLHPPVYFNCITSPCPYLFQGTDPVDRRG